jgi:predicted DNA-binding transcriptional regulator AlpA
MVESMKQVEITAYPDGRLDCENAAKYLGRSKKTLDMWRVNGTGPKFIKTGGGRVFYFLEDLDSWINGENHERRVTSTAAARLAVRR